MVLPKQGTEPLCIGQTLVSKGGTPGPIDFVNAFQRLWSCSGLCMVYLVCSVQRFVISVLFMVPWSNCIKITSSQICLGLNVLGKS